MGKALGDKVCDIDRYFETKDGIFKFDLKKAPIAFRMMYRDVQDELLEKRSAIVVASFLRHWEMNGYLMLPFDKLQVIDVHSDFSSIHGVPPEKMKEMRGRWEPWKK